MTHRGRGTLEINPSRNPFFQTTSSDIGAKVHERAQIDWDRPRQSSGGGGRSSVDGFSGEKINENIKPSAANNYGEDFSFLYTRSSDTIGGKIEKKPNALALCMDTGPTRHKRLQENGANIISHDDRPKKNVEAILQSYTHAPKDENPLYTTSGNDYGRKPPGVATYVAERAYRPQDFSKSFIGIKPKNSSLNTSVNKSHVHPKLDPQFI
jgi:hypothetical protein